MEKLLIDDYPLLVYVKLAEEIGLNEAIVLQQVKYWLNRSNNKREGKMWVYNTYEDWKEQFPFWSISTIRRTINNLEKKELLISDNFNTWGADKTKWYTINYDKLKRMNSEIVQNEQSESSKRTDQTVQDEQSNNHSLPKTSTKTNKDKPLSSKQPKKIYGEMENVKLTDAELGKLKEKFPNDYEDRIETLSLYIAQQAKDKYKNHYAVICQWAKRDKKKTNGKQKEWKEWID